MSLVLEGVRTVQEARNMLKTLEKNEHQVEKDLELLLEQQGQMDVKMSAFRQMLPNLQNLSGEAVELANVVTRTSNLAESVSSKVRVLDLAKSRVYSAMKRVDDVIDLKSCVEGVQLSMNTEDYERAAAHIHRYLMLDQSILLETTADNISGSSTMSKSFAILREEEVKLKKLVNEKFTEATERRDSGSIDRFLKIFPLLNLHEDGMAMFCSHLSKTIEEFSNQQLGAISLDSGKRSGVAYADTLTLLYERVARTIEKEQPTVETFYGPSWLLYLIKKLQLVCDKQAVEIIHQLHEERQLDRKVQTIGFALNSRSASTAIKPDILELDTLLLELSLCSARTELYFRFLRKKMEGIMETSAPSGRALKSPPNSSKDVEVNISDIIHDSKINHLIQELIGKYIVIENYFMKESLTKAVNMDSCNSDGLTSSMADDIFFVLQKCIRRAFSSANVDGACAMLNHASSLLLTDYKEELQNKLNTCFPSGTGLDFSGMIPSKLQSKMSGSSTDKSESGKMTAMITVNDIEVTVVNVHKLTDELQAECSKLVLQVGETGKRKLDSCLADFSSVGATFKELRQSGIGKILEMILLPQIRPSINAFSSISHSFDENDLANFEVNDPFVQQLVSTLEQSLTDVKGSLLRQVYDQLLADMTSDVAILLEQQVFKCSFNQLGGVQLDKDLRMLVAYLSSQTNWPVRDKFSRLMQMATILNFETAREILDYWGPNAGPVVWRLTPSEVRKVLQLRVDFNPEDINHIKL